MYREWKIRQIQREYKFCHPCWPIEEESLRGREDNIQSWKFGSFVDIDGWMVIEIVIVIIYTVYTTVSVIWMLNKNVIPGAFWNYFRIPLLITIWLGLNRPLMYLQSLGPFIQMLEQTMVSTGQFAFLFIEFLVPFVCGIWILFGSPEGKLLHLFGAVQKLRNVDFGHF